MPEKLRQPIARHHPFHDQQLSQSGDVLPATAHDFESTG
jgi:hypothetical protein